MRRLRLWKVLVGAAVLLALSLAGLWVRIELKWAAMEFRVAEMASEGVAAQVPRIPLRSPAIPGNAWNDYESAFSTLNGLKGSFPDWSKFSQSRNDFKELAGKLEGDPAFLDAILPATDAIRRGAGRVECRAPANWISRWPPTSFSYSEWWRAGWSVGAGARRLSSVGKRAEAFELLLAGFQASVDLGRDVPLFFGVLQSLSMSEVVLLDLGTLLRDHLPEESDLRASEPLLAALDSVFYERLALGLSREVLREGRGYLQGVGNPEDPADLMEPTWRDFWSRRALQAGVFHRSIAWLPRGEEIFRSRSYEEERAGWDDLRTEVCASNRMLDRYRCFGWVSHGHFGVSGHRSVHARLRMIRVAIRFLIDGSILPLEDPGGGPLALSAVGYRLRIQASTGPYAVGRVVPWDSTDLRGAVLEVERRP